MTLLDTINSREALCALNDVQLRQLCDEIRQFLVLNVARTGGHLASNLGVVELSVALERVFDTSRDRLLFDVGHQSYVHKILTGRRDEFRTLRMFGGLAGFPKPSESVTDPFVAGHASSSVSTALGMARARTLQHEDYHVVALMGDGAMTGGLAYEAMNDAGESSEQLIVILNDNGMSINKNVGGMATLLSKQRVKPSYLHFKQFYRNTVGKARGLYKVLHHVKEHVKDLVLPNNMFDDMGFYYIGPVDGHDEQQLEKMLRWARDLRQPVLLHVVTQKGKGISYTEQAPEKYHGVSSFDPVTGALPAPKPDFSHVFGETLSQLADEDPTVVAITAAMQTGTGLTTFAERHPDRLYDVGIAEGHAITMASGMAKQGLKPVAAIYSSFLQRAYDMLIHDTSLQRLHLVLGVDRAGIVGADGPTHHGVFDLVYARMVPNMRVLAPSNEAELVHALHTALAMGGPFAIRYPRGEGEGVPLPEAAEVLPEGKGRVVREGDDVAILAFGRMVGQALGAADTLAEQGVSARVVDMRWVKPLDVQAIQAAAETKLVVTVEEGVIAGGAGEGVLGEMARMGLHTPALNLGIQDAFVTQGGVGQLLHEQGLDAEGIAASVQERYRAL